jgi:hypothetical protein
VATAGVTRLNSDDSVDTTFDSRADLRGGSIGPQRTATLTILDK